MAGLYRPDVTLTIRSGPEGIRAWADCRRLACLLEAKREGRSRPRKHGRGRCGGPALALRAFSRLRRSLIVLCKLEGLSNEEIDAVLLPNRHLRPEDKARRAKRAGEVPAAASSSHPSPPTAAKRARKVSVRPLVD